jgi:hypothetical protein
MDPDLAFLKLKEGYGGGSPLPKQRMASEGTGYLAGQSTSEHSVWGLEEAVP